MKEPKPLKEKMLWTRVDEKDAQKFQKMCEKNNDTTSRVLRNMVKSFINGDNKIAVK